ncbi:hypothetical protein R1sor_018838 [Riccia sorocarpa]|uniref:Rhodanese domain-containing protein n=1 Tax=Riccia sorocarpa TaxID=122646 RepID=A0ABD3IBZ2_9MARC
MTLRFTWYVYQTFVETPLLYLIDDSRGASIGRTLSKLLQFWQRVEVCIEGRSMAASACNGILACDQITSSLTTPVADVSSSSSRCRIVSLGARSRSITQLRSSSVGFRRRKIAQRRLPAWALSTRAEVQFVSVEEAKEMVEKDGYKILDIRDKTQYERSHIPSSVHVPYFIENTDSDIGTVINRQLHNNFAGLLYGLAYTKPNPEFIQEVTSKFEDREQSKLLLVCQEGLRSGYAAEKLEGVGFKNLAYINAGLNKVPPGVFPKEGEKELQDAGKGGLVTIQGPVSRVVGIILILAYLFLQFFPDQANDLFFKS